ncbi:hypothetical protein [Nonomuraea rhizosphaerae]|uniref:hypothetical protein n=1 Tax=Nonomuraea rhizosphaerae TaxID=2665663 RepID=UPI001C607E4D|nr:hypothetical protein [Nonomuraea rhizosphaerae]
MVIVIARSCSRLRIRELVDVAALTHGQAVEVLMAGRLSSSAPLVCHRFEQFCGGGHFAPLEATATLAAAIRNFLDA